MIEGTEEKFSNYMDRMITAMLSIAEDKEAPVESRVQAAKIIDGANDSMIKQKVMTEMTDMVGEKANKLLKQVEDLKPRRPYED